MKVEVEICTIEKSVLIGMVKRIVTIFAIENTVLTPEDNYIKSSLSEELTNLENLGLVSYYNFSSLIDVESAIQKQIEHKGE